MSIPTFDFGPEDDTPAPVASPPPPAPPADVAAAAAFVLGPDQLPVDVHLSPAYRRTVTPGEHSAALLAGYRAALRDVVQHAAENRALATLAAPRSRRERLLTQLAATTAAEYPRTAIGGHRTTTATGMYTDDTGAPAVTVTDDGATLTAIDVHPGWAAENGADHVRDELLRAVDTVRARRSATPPADPCPGLSDAELQSRLITHVTELFAQEAHR